MHENVIMQWKHFQRNVKMFKIIKIFCLYFKIIFLNIRSQISSIRVKMNTRIIRISIRFLRSRLNEIIKIIIKITRVTINEIVKIAMIKTIILFIHKSTISKINNVCSKHFHNKNKFHERNSRSISSFRQWINKQFQFIMLIKKMWMNKKLITNRKRKNSNSNNSSFVMQWWKHFSMKITNSNTI